MRHCEFQISSIDSEWVIHWGKKVINNKFNWEIRWVSSRFLKTPSNSSRITCMQLTENIEMYLYTIIPIFFFSEKSVFDVPVVMTDHRCLPTFNKIPFITIFFGRYFWRMENLICIYFDMNFKNRSAAYCRVLLWMDPNNTNCILKTVITIVWHFASDSKSDSSLIVNKKKTHTHKIEGNIQNQENSINYYLSAKWKQTKNWRQKFRWKWAQSS